MGIREETPRDPERPITGGTSRDTVDDGEIIVTEEELMSTATAAVTHAQGGSGLLNKRRTAMGRSYRSFNNQHSEKSKYLDKQYGARAKKFVPKTRSAVVKNQVAAATALFSTDDVVSVRAENDADDYQQASAEIIKGLLNIRLDRTNYRAGIPWFHKCMKAVQDSNIAGFCVAKTYWQYKVKNETYEEDILDEEGETYAAPPVIEEPFGGGGAPALPAPPPSMAEPPLALPAPPTSPPGEIDDGMSAAPAMVPKPPVMGSGGATVRPETFTYDEEIVVRDRPFIDVIPPENVIPDLAAPDDDVVQGGMFFIVQYPMHVGDVRTRMREGHQHLGGGPWREIPDQVMGEAVRDYNAQSVRMARGQGADRYDRQNTPSVSDLDIVWVHENFVRAKNNCDYHFWSLGTKTLLSTPQETIDAYPAHRGERPYVMGLGFIKSHSVLPMSPVKSWAPLQDELNDARNLTNDTMRASIAPIAKVVRGKQVDLRQVRERGPDATILVSGPDDVTFDRAPEATSTAFVWQDRIAVELDELAGNFSQSAVQQNRNLNETVGGMKLLSGSASGKTEYDLRVFVETWVEPVLRQIVWLEQYYETDEVLIALAGDKAKLWQRFGLDPLIDNLLEEQVTIRVNVGIGAADPMQKLSKLGAALDMVGKVAASGALAGQIKVKAEPLCDEIFGLAGYNEANRFMEFKSLEEAEAEASKVPPEVQIKMRELDIREKEIELEMQEAVANNDARKAIAAQNNQTKIQIEKMKIQAEMARQAMGARQELMLNDRQSRQMESRDGRQAQFQESREGRQFAARSQQEMERDARRARSEAERDKRRATSEQDRERRQAGFQGARDAHRVGSQGARDKQLADQRMQEAMARMQAQQRAATERQQARPITAGAR